MNSSRTLYEILGLQPDATDAEIKSAYRRLARQVHPDVGGSAAVFGMVTEAYETLIAPDRRDAYDRTADTTTPPERQAEPEPSSYREPKPSAAHPIRPPARVGVVAALALFVIAIAIASHSGSEDEIAASESVVDSQPSPVTEDTPGLIDSEVAEVPTEAETSESSLPVDEASTSPTPTCADVTGVKIHYSLASAREDEGIGTNYWPRVTVRNNSAIAVTVTFDGRGVATNPDFPDYPLEMTWGGDDGDLTVRAGQRKTVELGKDYGEVLAVFNGGHITSIRLTAEATPGDGGYDTDDTVTCPVKVTRK